MPNFRELSLENEWIKVFFHIVLMKFILTQYEINTHPKFNFNPIYFRTHLVNNIFTVFKDEIFQFINGFELFNFLKVIKSFNYEIYI